MKKRIRRLLDLWATRSLLVGGIATAVDLACLVTAVELFGWPRVPAAMAGVALGATVSFFLNKYFAFRDHHSEVAPQAARYVLATGTAMLVHAGMMFLLTNVLGVFYVVSKFVADALVFSGGHLLLMRFLVFPRAAKVLAETVRSAGEEAEQTPAAAV